MNCEDKVLSREDAIKLAELKSKESNIQLCNWFLQCLGTGMTTGMIRRLVHNKIVEISGEGEKA